MTDSERLLTVLAELAQTLVSGYDVDEILDRLCDTLVEVLPVTGAGVMLLDRAAAAEGHLVTVAASDPRIHAIERVQIAKGEGPCLEAWRSREQIVEDDLLAAEGRWPAFTPAAVAAGIRAVYSFPMSCHDQCIGAVNLFSKDAGSFGEVDRRAAQLLTDMATAYVVSSRTLDAQVELSQQLQRALDGRVVIEQAKGKLAQALDLSVDDAFLTLRSYARANRRRLHDVAREVVEGTIELPLAQPPG